MRKSELLSCIGNYILLNGQICKSSEIVPIDNSNFVVYEVLRIIDYIPLFFNDHISRMFQSCELLNKKVSIDVNLVFNQLIELSRKNNFSFGNVILRLVFHENRTDFIVCFIPHHYPDLLTYKNGIDVAFLFAERMNPKAKVIQPTVRTAANEQIKQKGVYEVLLVNHQHQITEGSRSNLFFIRNNVLITAPFKTVLKGITLCKVIELANHLGIKVINHEIFISDLPSIDALFITGTSPKILPIRKVEDTMFNVDHPIIRQLFIEYNLLIKKDIEETCQKFYRK